MTPILWGRATSVNVQKVMWALQELQIPHQRLDAGGRYGWPAALAQLNPNRRVPVWQEDELVLWESHAILRYLAGKRLGPDPLGDQWMEFTTSTLQPAFLGVFYQKVRFGPAERDPAVLAAHQADLEAALDAVDAHLRTAEWLGGSFSVADIAMGSMMYRYFDMEIPRGTRHGLAAWVERLKRRPAYRAVVETSYEELRAGA
ncbi:MAG: glutathione S-transferase family protein [Pseudomonadota bacterium]